MTWEGRDAEELRERGETNSAAPPSSRRRASAAVQRRRLGQAPAVDPEQLPLQKALIEARVVCDEECVARKVEEAANERRRRWCAPQLLVA